jgi:coenzyme F420-dependent glucose-6-phosphate dehydrogenase
MIELGYALSSEEHGPRDLVANAKRAEGAGFSFASISDHYHPWIDRQGESPFVWSVIGAIAEATEKLRLMTGVTCPMIRIHPAIIAQAAATSAALMPGRFYLGLGTGENLNEHILGDRWPPGNERLEMLEEALEVIRLLWQGDESNHRGRHYTVDHARVYSLPEQLPPILIAAKGEKATALAARADGLVSTAPDKEQIELFEKEGGGGKPRFGMIHVCWAEDEQTARKIAHEWWPTSALKGEVGVELPLPRHFEQAAEMVTEDDVAESTICGPDPERHIEEIMKFEEAGYDHVYIHQVGPHQAEFIDFYEHQVMPKLR